MRLRIQGQLWVIIFLACLMRRNCEGLHCPRDIDKVKQQLGRTCRRQCSYNDDCEQHETCNCDDYCGMSCFDKNDKCIVPTLENGRVVTSTVTSYGTMIRYKCNHGYQLSNNKFRTCRSDGKWSGDIPYCSRKTYCDTPSSITNGRIASERKRDTDSNAWVVGDSVMYQCEQDYQLVGSNVRICLYDGNWTGTRPRCKFSMEVIPPVESGYCSPPIIENGWIENDRNWGDQSQQQPPSDDDDNVPVSEIEIRWRTNDVIVYRCKRKYELIGGSKRQVCKSDGDWTGQEPRCIPRQVESDDVFCQSPISPSNGVLWPRSQTAWKTGDLYSVECAAGYQSSAPYSVCLEDGSWSVQLQCVLLQKTYCETPADIDNGFFESDEESPWEVYSTVTYRCNYRFELSAGSNAIVCTDEGKWRGYLPSCKAKIYCGNPTEVSNGWIEGKQEVPWAEHSVVTYQCREGFKLSSGSNSLVCTSRGIWEGYLPKCEEIPRFCGKPIAVNGYAIPRETSVWRSNDFVKIECFDGFIPPLPNYSTCQANGIWTVTKLICKKNVAEYCQSPPRIEGGWIENIRNVEIAANSHSQDSTNDAAGPYRVRWMPADVIVYKCKNGYVLDGGDKYRVCMLDGTWSGTDPHCKIIQNDPVGYCLSPPSIGNGWIESDRNVEQSHLALEVFTHSESNAVNRPRVRWLVNDVIIYKCRNGFELFGGSKRRVCSITGDWTGNNPNCKLDNKFGIWRKLSNGIFYAATKESTSFPLAVDYCASIDGSLAASTLENSNVMRELFDSVDAITSPGEKYWIGLTDRESENVWKWLDDVEMTLSALLERFDHTELLDSGERDCAIMIADPSKKWLPGDCANDKYFAICQKDSCVEEQEKSESFQDSQTSLDWKQSAFPRGFEASKLNADLTPSEAEQKCKLLSGWIIDSYEVKGNLYVNPETFPGHGEGVQGRGLFSSIGFFSKLSNIFETVRKWFYPDTDTDNDMLTTPEPNITTDQPNVTTAVYQTRPSKEKLRSQRSVDENTDENAAFICERHSKTPVTGFVHPQSTEQQDFRSGFDEVEPVPESEPEPEKGDTNPEGRSLLLESDEVFRASGDEVAVVIPMVARSNETFVSDRKNVCQPNPCLNDCVCESSSFYGYSCESTTDHKYIGNNCEFESPKVLCGHEAMKVTLSGGVIREMDGGAGNGIMYVAPDDNSASSIRNIEESCLFGPSSMDENIFIVLIPFPFDTCGTKAEREVDGKITFGNTIWFNRILVEDFDATVHSSVVEISCSYQDLYKVTSLVDAICCPTPPLITSNGVFKFQSSMWIDPPGQNGTDILSTGRMRTRVRALNGVVSYRVGEMLYLTVSMTSNSNRNSSLVPTLKICWMSPYLNSQFPNLHDLQLYPSNGSRSVNIYGPINSQSAVHFGFQLIKVKKSTRVYLHCQIQVFQQRRKRSINDDVKENEFSVVTKGPIEFVETPNMENAIRNNESAHQLVLGISLFGIAVLVLLISCCLVHVRKLHERERLDVNANQPVHKFSSRSKRSKIGTVSSVVD